MVHTAPGHGQEDYIVGQRYGLPILSPVDDKGNFTAEAGQFAGLNVLKDANEVIIKELQEKGSLLKENPINTNIPTIGGRRNRRFSGRQNNGSPRWKGLEKLR